MNALLVLYVIEGQHAATKKEIATLLTRGIDGNVIISTDYNNGIPASSVEQQNDYDDCARDALENMMEQQESPLAITEYTSKMKELLKTNTNYDVVHIISSYHPKLGIPKLKG
jgi:hypothetical protein